MNSSVPQRNPLAILFVTLVLLAPVLLSLDTTTPVVFFLLGIAHLGVAGPIDYRRFLKTVGILSTLGVGLFLLNFLFPAKGVNGLLRGITVFLRSVSLISLSVGYIFLVDPYDLVRSLMNNLRLPARIGFALFAGWNIIPLLRRDLRIIQHAHAIRTGGQNKPFRSFLRAAIVLLAGAVRHAERVTLSMAARGIEEGRDRTFIKPLKWRGADTVHCLLGLLAAVSALAFIVGTGRFVFALS